MNINLLISRYQSNLCCTEVIKETRPHVSKIKVLVKSQESVMSNQLWELFKHSVRVKINAPFRCPPLCLVLNHPTAPSRTPGNKIFFNICYLSHKTNLYVFTETVSKSVISVGHQDSDPGPFAVMTVTPSHVQLGTRVSSSCPQLLQVSLTIISSVRTLAMIMRALWTWAIVPKLPSEIKSNNYAIGRQIVL